MSDAYPTPAIFLGYIVTKPHDARRGLGSYCSYCSYSCILILFLLLAAPYRILQEDGRVFDIEEDDMERW